MGDLTSEYILAKRGDGQQKQKILTSGYRSIFDDLPSLQALAPRDDMMPIITSWVTRFPSETMQRFFTVIKPEESLR